MEHNKYNLEAALNLDNLFLDAPEKYAVTRLFFITDDLSDLVAWLDFALFALDSVVSVYEYGKFRFGYDICETKATSLFNIFVPWLLLETFMTFTKSGQR